MATATWNGAIIAQSDDVEIVEGNVYFPLESVNPANLQQSDHVTVCGWKGTCNYFDVVVGTDVNAQAAWTYRDPKSAAANIRGHVAFWRGVQVNR